MSLWAVDVCRDVAGHDIGRGQGFAGVGKQAFVVLVWSDLEHGAGFVGLVGVGGWFQVVVLRTVGGVVAFFLSRGIGRGKCFRFRGDWVLV
ncbi:hypothetical protein BK675_15685 [Pseudomonas fluorescens]|uniref:Uncharacterized protein n=1 Tax=Pseudomonas moraviensis R28-S TaxID=1395516 RepID=V8R3D5_9PSED|nr:hypothetical protein PMO01_21885 [Pseudomonas moraviensis R28-S]RON67608.1 hypothetical protein BK677_26195 [Pseudomonas fluorescens]ROO06938.1 hypothetical protein BK675_15685 [Pseudomonas fluorescens]ROO14923.1 hypothetical protein BK676_20875 [Pseudomonas fluorescens]